MKEQTSCNSSIKKCIDDKYFSIAHLYNEEKPMNMHIHDCYEIYYSISGGRQFLIDNKFYDINPGDIFVINEFESHYISKLDKIIHERIVISIYPEFLKSISSKETNLALCFSDRNEQFCHKVSLDKEQQNRFLYFINKITTAEGFGSDMIEYATFLELMTSINKLYISNNSPIQKHTTYQYNEQVEQILKYINQNITDDITIEYLANHFFLSKSYICRIFKSATGTTINKYLSARRISIAKSMLSDGLNVNDVCEKCGFNDYSNFLKTFKKAVGISPKKYSQFSIS
ncbi:MAG: AraC family transcriptional regulator [Clostridium sp.]|uniref:AraC family transcriptional regulator n=1 Tax=Clostridium sp. DSM 8431 TaxID=1761781 RepID=UPI0008E737D8|nr:AraC family transcriptional regulator [Clostridium sp. DSM 8431]MCR4944543.1 AraC family transcriptional regulator [Clostridium sp.]SFU48992.1 transcriptional regulator, AraC family [Clostridium sp. DSM 8431]